MGNTVMKVEKLGKRYFLRRVAQERYRTLRDDVTQGIKNLGKRLLKKQWVKQPSEELWALRDVSFTIEEGNRTGVIGRNGAGKSTLLKILSRITEPTTGRVHIKGRVASLLEVGTGFHQELTGRENIYLSGAILGMTKSEIKNRFDQIISFAEVEKFLETPVKRYSSGMYLRLAFAVAAHLDPEIFLVDEVLAVGDAEFQKKCLGRMKEIGKQGRTVLFVSHNMNAIEQLCTNCLMLDKGEMRQFSSDVRQVIREYLFHQDGEEERSEWTNVGSDFDNPWFNPFKMFISDGSGKKQKGHLSNDSEMWLQIEAEIKEMDPALTVGYAIYNEEGILLYWSYQTDGPEGDWPKLKKGRCTLRGRIPRRFLNEGDYRIELIGGLHFRMWLFEPGVHAPSVYLHIKGGLSDSPLWMVKRPGALAPIVDWTCT
jgi:lipopolysaccharide transport system ATP-binding protein